MKPCRTCSSAHVSAVDEAIVAGERLSVLSRKYALGRESLRRHKAHLLDRRRLRDSVVERGALEDIASGRPPRDPVADLFGKIGRYEKRLERVVRRAERKGKNADIINATRELSRLAELAAKGSAAMMPKQLPSGVGQLIQEASERARQGREREWAERRSLGARELLARALELFDLQDDAAIGHVAEALRKLQGEAATTAVVVREREEPVADAIVVEQAEAATSTLAPVVPLVRPQAQHVCRPGQRGSFWCPACLEREQDGGDSREPTDGRDWNF